MFIYCILAAIVGAVAGIIIAARKKKAEGLEYGKLDKAGIVTNILLIFAYVFGCIFSAVIVMFMYRPNAEGFLSVVAWALAIIGATCPVFCGIGLGASASLRKQGKSKKSFLVQFAGIAALGITILFGILFYGNLFATLN